MAFIRCCIIAVVWVFCMPNTNAQTVYYPVGASQLLKTTAADVAQLLQKAILGSQVNVQQYTTLPSNGIVFIYDSIIKGNQTCIAESNGTTFLKFKAPEDNGLVYGVYEYLNKLGFKFYQPGSIWEIIPNLTSPYKNGNTSFTNKYKYKTWFISGGHNRWIMDNNASYGWDNYYGDNGHNWALYQRRNGMLSEYKFTGHRGDIMNANYIAALQSNPCYIAAYNGERKATPQSVPDINNAASMQMWSNAIEQKYTANKNILQSNPTLFINQLRNFKYGDEYLGIEVPDGSQWGNSMSTTPGCNAQNYPSETDQHFILANHTAQKINSIYPDKKFQVYAYASHANIPSSSININKNIDVQLVPTVYQLESSTNGLRNKWYNRFNNISEYHFLNLSGWSGETPSFKWSDLKSTLQIANDKKLQGLMWEASPAKFGSLPYLLAANSYLKDGIAVDSTLKEFCTNMFGKASISIYKILQMWGNENTAPSKHKMQLYVQLLNRAVQQIQDDSEVIKSRIIELKAYMHYMVMYFDLANNDNNKTVTKADKDAAICMYLAKANKMQLVNSYYLINTIVSKYATTSDFYVRYNVTNGTAYNNGNLALLTTAEIENNFLQDVANYSSLINDFVFEEEDFVQSQFESQSIAPLQKINTRLYYTNGANYYNKTAFNLIAPHAGSFTIQYKPAFEMKDKGYVNFVIENADVALQIIKDVTINNTNGAGTFKVDLPKAGKYLLTIVSKYKTILDLSIITNGNYFYKKGPFLGNKTETYQADVASLPGYFYIPNGLDKIYFNVLNSFSNGKYASADAIGKSFNIKDNYGNLIKPRFVTPKDSTLFYLEIPQTANGTFWQATTMGQYNLQFVNISNLLWYATPAGFEKANSLMANEKEELIASVFPNPSTGMFKCIKEGQLVTAESITILSAEGTRVATFKNVNEFNISNLAAGVYLYTMQINGKLVNRRLVKL